MMCKQPIHIKWEVNFVAHKQNYKPNKCFLEELGDIQSENVNRRTVDSSGVKVTHQSTRTKATDMTLLICYKMFFLKTAHFQVDNTTGLSHLMKMGGTGSREITALAKEVWEFTLSQKIIIIAEYLPVKLNVRADLASRNFQDSSK